MRESPDLVRCIRHCRACLLGLFMKKKMPNIQKLREGAVSVWHILNWATSLSPTAVMSQGGPQGLRHSATSSGYAVLMFSLMTGIRNRQLPRRCFMRDAVQIHSHRSLSSLQCPGCMWGPGTQDLVSLCAQWEPTCASSGSLLVARGRLQRRKAQTAKRSLQPRRGKAERDQSVLAAPRRPKISSTVDTLQPSKFGLIIIDSSPIVPQPSWHSGTLFHTVDSRPLESRRPSRARVIAESTTRTQLRPERGATRPDHEHLDARPD